MQSTTYKLAEYKITENEHGDLLWETHIGLGSLRIGKCFINGDILFIRPNDSKGPGFLKGEFLDHLNKMPKWGKTKYYCASYKIYNCKSVYYSKTGAICRSFGEDKAVNTTGPENFVVNKKTFAAGKNIKPTNLSITIAKDKITTFFKLLKI